MLCCLESNVFDRSINVTASKRFKSEVLKKNIAKFLFWITYKIAAIPLILTCLIVI